MPEPDELFTAEATVTATAFATHPDGADVPPPFIPAADPAASKEHP